MKYLYLFPPIFWLLVSGLLNAAGEYLSKRWGDQPTFYWLCLVAMTYALSSVLWLPALLHENKLSVMGTAWLLIATLSTIAIGVLLFKEHLSPIQWLGVVLSVFALLLLGWKH